MQTHRSKYWYDSACKTRRVFELKIALLSSKLTETRTEDRNGAIVCCSKQYMILPWKNDPTEIVGNWPEVKPEVFEKRDPCRNKIFRYKNPCIDCFWAFILTVGQMLLVSALNSAPLWLVRFCPSASYAVPESQRVAKPRLTYQILICFGLSAKLSRISCFFAKLRLQKQKFPLIDTKKPHCLQLWNLETSRHNNS